MTYNMNLRVLVSTLDTVEVMAVFTVQLGILKQPQNISLTMKSAEVMGGSFIFSYMYCHYDWFSSINSLVHIYM